MCGSMLGTEGFVFDEVVGIEAPLRAVTRWTGGILPDEASPPSDKQCWANGSRLGTRRG